MTTSFTSDDAGSTLSADNRRLIEVMQEAFARFTSTIESRISALDSRMSALDSRMSALETKMDEQSKDLDNRLTCMQMSLESRISKNERTIADLKADVAFERATPQAPAQAASYIEPRRLPAGKALLEPESNWQRRHRFY